VRQRYPSRALQDVGLAVRETLAAQNWAHRVPIGARVAIGVGSRGISNIALIVREVVAFWKERGARPFIVPVMGSHGSATAEGQAAVLAQYGIDPARMGCPVVSSLDVVALGRTPEGIEVVMDKAARECDAVMLVSRVKWHTDFDGRLESGIYKMMAIGLGKLAGAQRYHTYAVRMGLERVIRSVGRQVLSTNKIVGGLAILEDAYHDTAEVHAVGSAGMEQREEELLARVKSWAPRIPVSDVDLLIVDEMGKEISGGGMDTKIVNRAVQGESNVWPNAPRILRIFVRDLTPLSYGNAIGVGMADVITDRFYNKIDRRATETNGLTASATRMCMMPPHFATDRMCLEKIVPTLGRPDTTDATIVWIRNTLDLSELMVSENLRLEIEKNTALEILGDGQPLEFTDQGELVEMLPASGNRHGQPGMLIPK
jgi:hypothetical protein